MLRPHYQASSLIWDARSLRPAPVLSLLQICCLSFSLLLSAACVFHSALALSVTSVDSNARTTGFHVPYKSLCQARAAFTPGTIWAVNRLPPNLSRVNDSPSVLMPLLRFRRLISGSFAFTFLTSPDAIVRAFSATLTTLAFDQRSLRWFETSSCKAVSEGLPPSLVQHRIGCYAFYLHIAPPAFMSHGRRHSGCIRMSCPNVAPNRAVPRSRAWVK